MIYNKRSRISCSNADKFFIAIEDLEMMAKYEDKAVSNYAQQLLKEVKTPLIDMMKW